MIKRFLRNIHKTIKMALIDLRKIYNGAVFGWFWVIAKPAVTIFMYYFLFKIGLKVSSNVDGYPYFIWLIVGMLPWFYISDMINTSPSVYKKYNYLVTKIKFPIKMIPTFMSLSRFIVNMILSMIVIMIYLLMMKRLDIYILNILYYSTVMFIFITIITSILALISALSKDISNLIKTISTPLLLLSPVFWNIKTIDIEFIKVLELYNPVAYFVNGYRDAFINNIWFYDKPLDAFIIILELIILWLVNIILYKKISRKLPDYL